MSGATASTDRDPPGALLKVLLVSQFALGLLAMTIALPSLQDWPAIFGASQARVQLTFSAYALAFGGLQLVWGPWSDRIGRKPVVLLGLAITTAGSVLAAFAPTLGVLVGGRFLQGIGAAACMVTGRAMVQDLFVGSERTRVMAFIGMTLGLCPPLGTVVGGIVHERLGWAANFHLIALLSLALALSAWRWLPAITPSARGAGSGPGGVLAGYVHLLRTPALRDNLGVLAMTTAAFYTFLAGMPLVLASYQVGPGRIGLYMALPPLGYLAGNLLTSRLARHRSDRSLMAAGHVMTVTGLLLTVAVAWAGPSGPLPLMPSLFLFGIGNGLLVPPTLSGTVGLVPALAGSAAALAGVMQQLGGAVGGWLVGLVPHHGPMNLSAMQLAWALLGMAFWLALRRR